MNLSFDNLDEFDQFLQWASRYGRAEIAPHTAWVTPKDLKFPELDAAARPEAGSDGSVAFDTPPGEPISDKSSDAPATEPAKRKRRTKAEIEADAKAEAEKAAAAAEKEGIRYDTIVGGQTEPEGANPFEQPAATPAAETGAPEVEGDAPEQTVTPFQHLSRAREFIAKHCKNGMGAYNATFESAGLDANVMAYTAEQRALHIAAMEKFDQA